MMDIARGTCFWPMTLRTLSAIAKAPPECSRKVPIITPAMMTMPMLPRVWPKPSLIDLARFDRGIPENRPNPIAANKRARKG